MEDKLITIAEFENYMQADLSRQTLEDFGIKAVVTGQNAANIYSGLTSIARPALQVMQSQEQKAREILESEKAEEQ